ncbi:hypothetical protein O6H91_16G032800 [Diphasiastrum complanatum]|uniref:Uncharacterized protein n=1 Tax=Diphasiastrum complanatum TaxID=34168 RepID=A0ACC2BB83_DIPCM|nr:hypothetical protein O6H91_16G032800 [Diphasiastrum complanatum]
MAAANSTTRALQRHLSQLVGLRSLASSAPVHSKISFASRVSEGKIMPFAGKNIMAGEVSESQGRGPSASQGCDGVRTYYTRNLSQLTVPSSNGKRAFLVDTLALVRRLEAQGLTAKQAEAITAVITEVLNDSLESVSRSFVSQSDLERELRFTTLQRETERLRTDIEKMRSELKYEIDKVTAGQRLDLNLERGRIRDELSNRSAEMSNLTNKLDKEIHALKTELEAAKYEVIKYCIGTIVSVTAVGLGLLRILM